MTIRTPMAADDRTPDAPGATLGPSAPADLDLDFPPGAGLGGASRTGRATTREKCAAGLRGLKHAMRGDSSFFAHAYRGLLLVLTAALLGVGPYAWALLILSAAVVLIAELAHSAVDTLARALGDPEDPALTAAREIATAGVLVAVLAMVVVAAIAFTLKLGEMLAWW